MNGNYMLDTDPPEIKERCPGCNKVLTEKEKEEGICQYCYQNDL